MEHNVTDWDVVKPWSEDDERFFGLIETASKKGTVINTPRAMGFTVLELSKLHVSRRTTATTRRIMVRKRSSS